jgi:hypothetical protein
MKKKVTITVDRVTEEDLKYFKLDSPGYFIARDGERAGEVAGAAYAVQVICLANKLYQMELTNRLIVELAPFGKIEEYARVAGTDAAIDLIVQTLGKPRCAALLKEVADYVKAEAKIGQNDKVTTE